MVRQLALQGDPVALNLLLSKSFLIPVNEGTFVTCGLKFLRNQLIIRVWAFDREGKKDAEPIDYC